MQFPLQCEHKNIPLNSQGFAALCASHTHTRLPCGTLPTASVIHPEAERITLCPIALHSTLQLFPREPRCITEMCCSQQQKGKKAQPFSVSCSTEIMQSKYYVRQIEAGSAFVLPCSQGKEYYRKNSHQPTSIRQKALKSQACIQLTLKFSSLSECNRSHGLTWDTHFLSSPRCLAHKGRISGIKSLLLLNSLKRHAVKDLFTSRPKLTSIKQNSWLRQFRNTQFHNEQIPVYLVVSP